MNPDPCTDIELAISDLDPAQARDVWQRINIIMESFIADGYDVTLGRSTYRVTSVDTEDE